MEVRACARSYNTFSVSRVRLDMEKRSVTLRDLEENANININLTVLPIEGNKSKKTSIVTATLVAGMHYLEVL